MKQFAKNNWKGFILGMLLVFGLLWWLNSTKSGQKVAMKLWGEDLPNDVADAITDTDEATAPAVQLDEGPTIDNSGIAMANVDKDAVKRLKEFERIKDLK